jgi:hypothetical protein
MKICNYTIGIRTRHFPACSTLPQPTAQPRDFHKVVEKVNMMSDFPRGDSLAIIGLITSRD